MAQRGSNMMNLIEGVEGGMKNINEMTREEATRLGNGKAMRLWKRRLHQKSLGW